MPFSHKPLTKWQIGKESTAGTAVAATEVLLPETGSFRLHDEVFYKPEQERGLLAANVETPFAVANEVEFTLEGSLYDRAMVIMALNAIRGNVTGVSAGGSKPLEIVYTIEPALTAPNTPDMTDGIDTCTLEWTDGNQARESEHIYTVALELTGKNKEDVKFSWEIEGRRVTATTFTPALTVPANRAFYAVNNAKWYVDTSYAGIGGTQKTGVVKEFTWRLETMFTKRYTADGNLYFTALNEDAKKVTLEMVFQFDTTVVPAEIVKFQAQTMSYQRLALFSQVEMDSGQNNPSYIWLDGAYRWTEVPELDDEDGNRILTMSAETFYDSTAAKQFGVIIGTLMTAW